MIFLRDHFGSDAAHSSAAGTASGIIGPPWKQSSPTCPRFAVFTTEEEAAAVGDDRMRKEDEVERTTKGQMRHIR